MKKSKNHEQLRDLVGEYVFGGLSWSRRRALERHLRHCTECSKIVSDSREAVAAIPLALAGREEEAPAPHVREALLARLDEEHLRIPVHKTRLRWSVGLAAGLALAISLAFNLYLSRSLDMERAKIGELLTQLGRQEIVLEVVDAPAADRKILRPVDQSSKAYGKVFTAQLPYVVVMVARLPQLRPDLSYHLWYQTDQGTVFAGIIALNEDGFGLLVIETDGPPPKFKSVLVTAQSLELEVPGDQIVLAWGR